MPLHSSIIIFELAFARLRYSLGGDRPSQTYFHKLFFNKNLVVSKIKNGISFVLIAPIYYYTLKFILQFKINVKVHGVFPSNCKNTASSREIQIHQVYAGDSEEIVTPFMQVGIYPTRNFATFGPSELQPPFTGASF